MTQGTQERTQPSQPKVLTEPVKRTLLTNILLKAKAQKSQARERQKSSESVRSWEIIGSVNSQRSWNTENPGLVTEPLDRNHGTVCTLCIHRKLVWGPGVQLWNRPSDQHHYTQTVGMHTHHTHTHGGGGVGPFLGMLALFLLGGSFITPPLQRCLSCFPEGVLSNRAIHWSLHGPCIDLRKGHNRR